jgi:PKHD-type hydroxylase
MLISSIPQIIRDGELQKIQNLLATAEFVDGRISGGMQLKQNREVSAESDAYAELIKLIEVPVRQNMEFNYTAFPRYMTHPIISMYGPGMFYKTHVDEPVMGFAAHRGLVPLGANYVRSDLSMTLFLTAKDSYDGGELCFDTPLGLNKVKLDAGAGVLYPTGSPHSVAMVTRGVRHAAVFWIQTMFPVEAHRSTVLTARRLLKSLRSTNPDSDETALAHEMFNNLCRILAEM